MLAMANKWRIMDLTIVELEKEYIIKNVLVDDSELSDFLFTLGCYSGEPITVISRLTPYKVKGK